MHKNDLTLVKNRISRFVKKMCLKCKTNDLIVKLFRRRPLKDDKDGQFYIIRNSVDFDFAVILNFHGWRDMPPYYDIREFHDMLVFTNRKIKKRYSLMEIYMEVSSYICALKDVEIEDLKREKKVVVKDSQTREEEDIRFDSFGPFDMINKKLLREKAYRKDDPDTDAKLLYGIYMITEKKDTSYGLSLITDAALFKNDRAAYILGWLNETKLLFSTMDNDINCRRWYREAAERGHQPAIHKIIEMINAGFYPAYSKELNQWKARRSYLDPAELRRIEYLKALLIRSTEEPK